MGTRVFERGKHRFRCIDRLSVLHTGAYEVSIFELRKSLQFYEKIFLVCLC